jgi:hypothetical protein
MARPATFWLAAPSRFAGLGKARARIALGLLVLLLLACLTALTVADPAAVATGPATSQSDQTDLMVYEKIVAGVKGGGDYYTVASDTLRAGGYPLRPFFTVRMPSLAVVQAALPAWGPAVLLYLLAAYVGMTWALRLAEALPRALPRLVALLLLIGSMLAFLQADLVAFHEIWAGLLIALSLGAAPAGALDRRGGDRTRRDADPRDRGALCSSCSRSHGAKANGARRFGWLAALALFAAALAAHAHAVAGVTGPLDPASPGWSGLLGFGFFVKAISLVHCAGNCCRWLAAALLVGLSLFGWAAWNDPLGLRMLVLSRPMPHVDRRVRAQRHLLLGADGRALCPRRPRLRARRPARPVSPRPRQAAHNRDKGGAMKRILLIVGGGIAAYKACELVRLCRKAGIGVKVVLTEGGSHFVTPMTLAALSENQVYTTSGISRTRPRWGISSSAARPIWSSSPPPPPIFSPRWPPASPTISQRPCSSPPTSPSSPRRR